MQERTRSPFWRDIVHTDLTRGLRYAVILLAIHAPLIGVDLIRLNRGIIPEHRGYYDLFLAHLVLVGVLAAFLVLYMLVRPADPDSVTGVHAALVIGFCVVVLFFCTAVTMIDQFIDGQITIYVIGCMTLAVAVYSPPQVSVPIYLVNHAAFIVGVTLLQEDRAALVNHYINGSIVMVLAVVITTLMYDSQKQVHRGMAIIREQQNTLERQATEDSLTGLYNRRYADARLRDEFERARRYSRPFSIGMADIDHFKLVNDRHSHQAGDEVLKHLASLFRAEIRAVDVVARYGGEEFVLIFPETDERAALAVCAKIRRSVERYNWHVIADGLGVTISIGVAGSPDAESLSELIRLSDERLYQAKRAGRNRVVGGDEGGAA